MLSGALIIPDDIWLVLDKLDHEVLQSFGPHIRLGVAFLAVFSGAALRSMAKNSWAEGCFPRGPV